ncbi:MAG: ATP-binding protein [Bdellovibrio sp.]
MKNSHNNLDLKKSCSVYSDSIRQTMQNLFAIELEVNQEVEKTTRFEDTEDIYFSVFFTGQVYGELLIGINRITALHMLDIPVTPGEEGKNYWENRDFVMESFKEIINIASGQALKNLKEVYPQVTITPPRATEGRLSLANFEFSKVKFEHKTGNFNCYMYIDKMQLDIATALEAGKKTIVEQTQQKEELNRLNKAKTEFLANMSHELRTPLNGMIGMVDILKSTELNQVQQEQLAIVSRSGEFLLNIINEILDFSKIESGRLELEEKEFNLPEAIENVAEALAPEVYRKNLDFFVTIDSTLPTLMMGDVKRLKQVILNLTGNAIKFTPTGSIEIFSRLVDQFLEISIKDTGVGIPNDKIASIFESFTQADLSDNRRYGGTGLGLTISKSIVEAMNGALTVTSQEAIGSTFTIRIPFLPKAANSLVSSAETPPKSSELRTVRYQGVCTKQQTIIELYRSQIRISADCALDEILFVDLAQLLSTQPQEVAEKLRLMSELNLVVVFLIKPNQTQEFFDFCRANQIANSAFLKLPVRVSEIHALLKNPKRTKSAAPIRLDEPKDSLADNKPTVLLVEDNPVNQLVARMMLERMNYRVSIANNGQEAVEKFKENRFEFILMDCQMPVMDGYAASIEIRELQKLRSYHTPIIALTANALKETKEHCFEAGMDDFATKPIRIDDLKVVIDRVKRLGYLTLQAPISRGTFSAD